MIGDVNFFLYPDDENVDEPEGDGGSRVDSSTQPPRFCIGEVDVMIAALSDRGRGLGRATVFAFLCYILSNLKAILCRVRNQ